MRNFIFCLLAVLSLPSWMAAQGISGKVVDEQQLPLPGVNVNVVGTTNATATDLDGNFTINANAGQQLEFTMIGFANQRAVAANGMSVVLTTSSTELSEVVVIGYGTANRRDLAGSIVKVSGSEVADKPNANPVASLQGKVAGLSVVNSGVPGQQGDIRIRGTVSLYQTQPLFVVDGVYTFNMSFVNPNDIESMEILKDPSSLAIFGNLGANGVIIVTTKRAKAGKTTVSLSSSLGVKSLVNKPEMTNGSQFRSLYDQQRVNQGVAPYPYYNLYNANTDWVDEIKEGAPLIQQYNLSVSSSSENNKVYLGAGFLREDGLIQFEEYKKFTLTLNDELKIGKNLTVGVNLNGYDARLPQMHDFRSALNATPLVAPRNASGELFNQLPSELGGAQIGNPLAAVEEFKYTQLNRETRLVGNVFAEVKFLQDFKFRATYLGDLGFLRNRGYTPVFDVYNAESDQTTLYSGNALTSVNQSKTDTQRLQQEMLLTYFKEFGKHDLTLMAGYTRNEEILNTISGSVRQIPGGAAIPNNPRWWYLNTSFGDLSSRISNSDQWERATVSYLARALYNYDGKYILNASFRRDRSSEIPNPQNFWAVGAAWEISKESFMQNQKAFNFLKIKGSVGELGNQFTPIHYAFYPNYVAGASAVFGENLVPAYVLAYRNNPNLKWETIFSAEGGIEFSALNNRLSFEANYYSKETKDLLTFIQGIERFYQNAGKISSKGFEFAATWRDKVGDLNYSLSGNLTTYKSNVESVFQETANGPINEVFEGPSIYTQGQPVGSFYGYVVEGVYQSYADILASPPSTLGSYDVGDLKFKDINGDGVVNAQDRTVIGNPTPDFSYGFALELNYRNFTLSADFQGVYGNEIYRDWGNGSTFTQFNYRADRLNAWNGPGSSNWEPRLNDASGYNTNNRSTYMIEDGSYIRLRNIQLAYDFNADFLSKLSVQNLKLYINAQNPVTWSKNSGWTPEAGGTPLSFGVDTGGYPVPAITSIGVSATF